MIGFILHLIILCGLVVLERANSLKELAAEAYIRVQTL